MGKLLKWVIVLAALVGLYIWLWQDHRMPEKGDYSLEMGEIRRLAEQIPGDKPSEVRFEKVSGFSFTESMVITGGHWATVDMPAYAFQLRYPDKTVIVDTALDRSLAKPGFMVGFYDDAAYARVERALDLAEQIVITHEHFDHSGGLANHPRLAQIWSATRLTEAQVQNVDRMMPAGLPDSLLTGYEALRYQRYHPLAPGMVLISAPGHTPGSQMVYVQLADGRELLMLGDVAWKARNIAEPRQRPRFVTLFLTREDREGVFAQLQALNRLAREEPQLHQIPGHDAGVVDALAAQGLLIPEFVLPPTP